MKWLAPFISPLPIRLEALLRISGSDKEHRETKRGHHYGNTYHRLFRPFKYRRLTLLEIGIGGEDYAAGGASLAAWHCYFPFGKIIGCDIQDKRQLAGGRIRVHILDQSSTADLKTLASDEGPFDIIIDDGSHVNEHQILTFKQLFLHMREAGVYIVEDVQTSYWPEFGGKSVDKQDLSTCMGYFTQLAKYLNYPEFRTSEEADPEMLGLAKVIGSIHFEHNLVVILRDSRERYPSRGASR